MNRNGLTSSGNRSIGGINKSSNNNRRSSKSNRSSNVTGSASQDYYDDGSGVVVSKKQPSRPTTINDLKSSPTNSSNNSNNRINTINTINNNNASTANSNTSHSPPTNNSNNINQPNSPTSKKSAATQYPTGVVENMSMGGLAASNVNRDSGGHFGNYVPFLSKDFMHNIIGTPRAPLGHMRPQDVYEQTQLRKQQLEMGSFIQDDDDDDNDDNDEYEEDDEYQDEDQNEEESISSPVSSNGSMRNYSDYQDIDEDEALQRAINESLRLSQTSSTTTTSTSIPTPNRSTPKKSVSLPTSKNNSPAPNKPNHHHHHQHSNSYSHPPSFQSPNNNSNSHNSHNSNNNNNNNNNNNSSNINQQRRKVRFDSPSDEIKDYYTSPNRPTTNNQPQSNVYSVNQYNSNINRNNNSNNYRNHNNNNNINISNDSSNSDENEEEFYENNPDVHQYLSQKDNKRLEERKMIKESRRIREEQEREFNESLRRDREKKEEEEEKKQIEEAMKLSIEIEKQNQLELKKNRLPVDPSIGLSADQIKQSPVKICEVVITLPPDGVRISRKFYVNNTLQTIRDWIDIYLTESNSSIDITSYEMVTNFPKETLSDNSKTLLDLNLYPRAILNLREP